MPSKTRNQLIVQDIREYIQDHDDKEEFELVLEGTNYATILKNIKALVEEDPNEEDLKKFIQDCEEKRPKPEPKEHKPKEEAKSVPDADTSDLKWLGLTKIKTEDLKAKFGEPLLNTIDTPETFDWRYEYKIQIGDKLYSVYDKLNEDDTFDPEDDIEWFAEGTGSKKLLESAI